MEDKKILMISVVCIMLGLSGIYVFSQTVDFSENSDFVKINGTVKKVYTKNGVTFVDLQKTERIVFFKEVNVNEWDKVEIIGKQERGFEIIGNDINVLNIGIS